MKKIFLCLLMLCPFFSFGQDNEIFDMVKKGKFTFEPLEIANSDMNVISNDMNLEADGYFFKYEKDSLSAYLPYVGTMESVPASESGSTAIEINSKVSNYSAKESSNGNRLLVAFDVYSNVSKEFFRVNVSVTQTGSCDVSFSSSKRSYISYTGTIK